MKRNTAIELLRLLTDEEMGRFRKFLQSPYFNNSKPVLALFDCLRKWHPDYKEERIRPQIFWKQICPTENFNEQKYWKLTFNLRTLIEKFMVVEEVQNDEFEAKNQLIKSHSRRNAHFFFEKETKSLVSQLESLPGQDIFSYFKAFWLKQDYFFHPLTDKHSNEAAFSIQEVMDSLDRFFVLAKLRFAAEVKNRERIFSEKTAMNLLEECLKLSEAYQEDNLEFVIYRTMLDLHDPERADIAYQIGRAILENNAEKLSRVVQAICFVNLRNYVTSQINKGRSEYWNESFLLSKIGLTLDLIVENNRISEITLINIVHAGCNAKAYKWVEDFIKSYQEILSEDIRLGTMEYGMGILYFQKKEYDKAIDYLESQAPMNHVHQQVAKMTSMKAWFEKYLLDNTLFDLLSAKLEAIEKYFRRDEVMSEQKKSSYVNFSLASKLLSRIVISKDEKHIDAFKKYMEDDKSMVSKNWLMHKFNEIIKGRPTNRESAISG